MTAHAAQLEHSMIVMRMCSSVSGLPDVWGFQPDAAEGTSANSGCYHSTMVDYSRAGRAGSAGSAGRNLNVCGRLW